MDYATNQSRPSPSRRVYGDLRQLAEDLQVGDFTALSAGIGIGEARPRTRFAPPPRPMATMAAKAPTVYAPSSPAPEVRRGSVDGAARAGHDGGNRRKLPFELKLVAWGVDLLFVALAALTALALATLLVAMRGGQPPMTADEWLAVRPVQWLASLSVFSVLGGLYGIYGLYLLLFKVVAGRTLGESLFFRLALVRKVKGSVGSP